MKKNNDRPILTEQSRQIYQPWNSAATYKDGDKVMLPSGQVVTIGDVGNGPLQADESIFDDVTVFDRLRTATQSAASIPSIIAEIDELLKPAGFCVSRIPQEEPAPEQAAEDMSDWRNWRKGDFVECITHDAPLLNFGQLYQIFMNDGEFICIGDEASGWEPYRFRFHSRPTGASK